MTMLHYGQQLKLVTALPPAADAAGRASVWINLRNAGRVYIKATLNQGNAAPITITPLQATTNTGTGSKALTDPCIILIDNATGTGDVMSAATPGVAITTDATLADKAYLMRIDPATLDINNGYQWLSVTTSASNAANITSIDFILTDLRYEEMASEEQTALV